MSRATPSLPMIPLGRGQIGLAVALAAMSAVGLVALVAFTGARSGQGREGAPTAGEVQAAYDREAASAVHDADLKIVRVDCRRVAGARFACRVDFVKADPARVFLDMAIVERRRPNGWKLVRGLCRNLS